MSIGFLAVLRGAMDSPQASSISHPSGACVGLGEGMEESYLATSDDEESVESRHSLLRVLGDGTATGKAQREQESTGAGSSSTGSPNKRMIGCDKAEAAGGDLVDPLGVEAERKQSKSECMPTGSSCA